MARILRKRGVVKSNFPRKAEFIQHVRACLAKAREAYPLFTLQDADLPIVFVKNGRMAGMAKVEWGVHQHTFNLEFSIEALDVAWDDMVKNTIPHEIAHIVDYFLHPRKSSYGHSRIWRIICLTLGGNGNTYHNYAVTKARTVTKVRFRYVASCGTEVWVTKQMHNKIQKGSSRMLVSTRGRITAEHCTWHEKTV